ncbi:MULTISPECIES: sugar ABC transporter permease [Streptomyces]|uniref:ABC transporter permease n=1 Tax=Streptomyces plicatus TaxID=1922 RepID=A0ABW1Y500_STRPL|nr:MULTISPECIES: ABC transporter permease subunit [Streptomyces]MBQ0912063.1 sugar ABC transporter permease [Streptomyces sp. RM99]MBU8559010.1 sugar ABC transporter permease [Streptomyces sp. Babs14]RSS28017.1 sugar ABC transporter permease [Streptomyces sp. WAC08452]RSS86806.1 sugar ABC transporter permease [Streptomyces sp. WAC02707]GGZ79148.1 polysaccharide ABC transporter ATP-binding protein [Streptomyces plicatus]
MSNSTVPRTSTEAETKKTPVASGDATGPQKGGPSTGKPSLRLRFRRDRALLLMTLPAVLLVLLFNYVPILGNVVAFQEYDPYLSDNGVVSILHSPWVGLENFQRIFEDSAFWNSVRNTLVLFVLQLVLYFPVPILLALLINSVVRPRVRAIAQAVLYLPHFFSWVLVIAVFQQLLGGAGLLSQLLRDHGYDGLSLMTDPDTFKFLVTAQSVWKDAGWGIIVFLAALASVSPDLYEAAAMDGANRWRRIWHVTLPALRPVIALLLVLRVGDALTVGFEQILLQRDAVGPGAAEVLDTFVWWNGVRNQDFGYAAAAGLVKGVISLGLVLIANKVAHLMGEQGVYKK